MEKKFYSMYDKARKRIFELGGQNLLALLSKIVIDLALEINVSQGSCLIESKWFANFVLMSLLRLFFSEGNF